MAKVLRDGKLQEIHVSEVVVGDIVYLQAGDKIPADGVIVDGAIKVDQAALNGETEEADKMPLPDGAEYDVKDLLNKFYAYRGTVVCGGEAYMEIKVVGDKTLFGELALEVQEETRETPLQVKLGKLAKQISTFGFGNDASTAPVEAEMLPDECAASETLENTEAVISLTVDEQDHVPVESVEVPIAETANSESDSAVEEAICGDTQNDAEDIVQEDAEGTLIVDNNAPSQTDA